MKLFFACLAAVSAVDLYDSYSGIEEALDDLDFYYTMKQKKFKDGKTITIKSREGDEFGTLYLFDDEPDVWESEYASDADDYLAVTGIGWASDGEYENTYMYAYETASSVEKGDSTVVEIEFEVGDEEGDLELEWKYGKKPNAFMGFLFRLVLILGIAGGAAYYFMM